MEIGDIRSAVLATIESVAPGCDVRRIEADRPLRQQIDLDSMDWLGVIARLRDALRVEIPESDYRKLATLDGIVSYVASRQAQHGSVPKATAPPPGPTATRHSVNGTAIVVRPLGSEDMALEAELVRHLSTEARYKRFMVTLIELPEGKLHYLTDVDQQKHVALAATAEREGRQVLLGVARYIVDPAGTGCEFAIEIDDAWQRSGLAGILMARLMEIARARGLASMEGIVLRSNARMLKFARQLGFGCHSDPDDPRTVRVACSLQETSEMHGS